MDNEFPKMLYRAPGPEALHGGSFATRIAINAQDEEQALADGWHLNTPDARAAFEASKAAEAEPAAAEVQPETAQPADLKAEAEALGITVDRRWGDTRLAQEIAKAKAAKG